MSDPVQPGRCPVRDGAPVCPPATEIDCIEVMKVYDQCIKEEVIFHQEEVPGDTALAPTDTIQCEVVFPGTTCDIFTFGPPDEFNFRNIVVRQNVTIKIRVFDACGVEKRQYAVTSAPITQFQDVFLYAPDGTEGQCSIVSALCEQCTIVTEGGMQYFFCKIRLCKEIVVKATVKLLLPNYGFCQPVVCSSAPQPGFPCPPPNLFPPKMEPMD